MTNWNLFQDAEQITIETVNSIYHVNKAKEKNGSLKAKIMIISKASIIFNGNTQETFPQGSGTRQGCLLFPLLSMLYQRHSASRGLTNGKEEVKYVDLQIRQHIWKISENQ